MVPSGQLLCYLYLHQRTHIATQPNVGNIAINDAFMLEAAIYYLLKKHFRSQKYYVDLMELFLETTFQTELGQLVDLITAPEDHVDLNKFSLEKYINLSPSDVPTR